MAEAPDVTLLSEAPAACVSDGDRPSFAASLHRFPARDLIVLAPLLWWALPLTHATGGRSVGHEVTLAVLLSLAAAVQAPMRSLPRRMLLGAAALGSAALLIPALAATGWRGADDALAYVCAALAFVVTAAWAKTPQHRTLVAAGITLAVLDQMSHALLPWWGGRDPSVELIGTFYWRNPFAAYLVPGVLLGFALAMWQSRPWRLVGWVAAPLGFAGVMLSTSRATLAVLLGSLAVLGLIAAAANARKTLLVRYGGLWALCVLLAWGLPGPPLFSHRVAALQGTGARSAAGETISANGAYRLEFWREAFASFRQHPIVGSGYHGLLEASLPFTPAGWARSPFAHNGFLQAFSDGGLLLGLPLSLCCAALAWVALRTLWHAFRGEGEPIVMLAALAVLALLAHSAVDFDWTYPSLFVMFAVCAGLLVSPLQRGATAKPSRVLWLPLIIQGMLGIAYGLGFLTSQPLGAAPGQSPEVFAHRLADAANRPLSGDVDARDLLNLAISDPTSVTRGERELALAKTARESEIDLLLAAERGRVALTIGEGLIADDAAAQLSITARGRPTLIAAYAPLLAAMGHWNVAAALLKPPLLSSLQVGNQTAVVLAAAWVASAPVGNPVSRCLVSGGTDAERLVTCKPLLTSEAKA